MKLKVRLNIHGIFNASNPQLVEKLTVQGEQDPDPEPMDTNEVKKDENEQKVDAQPQVGSRCIIIHKNAIKSVV